MNRETFIRAAHVRSLKAGRIELRPSMTVAEGFEVIVASCVRHLRHNAPLVVEHRVAEALHQSRVALRRLRSAFSLFEPATGGREFGRLDDELRFLAVALGEARNFDVYLQNDLPEDERLALNTRRDEAYDVAVAVLGSAHTQRLLADLLKWTTAGRWRVRRGAKRPLRPFLDRRIDRLWKKVAQARQLSRIGQGARHRLRIRTKKLRYGLEFARGLHQRHSKRRKAFRAALKALQDALGQLNDAAVARRLMADPGWPAVNPPQKDERPLLREAHMAMKRLRKAGAYW